MIVPFFIYDAVTGALLAGVVPTFSYFKRRNSDGTITTLTSPAITDRGGGLYDFEIDDDDITSASIIDYVIDTTAASASRYLEDHVRSDDAPTSQNNVPAAGSVATFGVTHDDVRSDYFPHWTSFSATTKPAAARVTQFILDEGADLGGRLMLKSISPSSITADDTPNAFTWCAKTLKLMVAVRVTRVATAQNPDVAKAWEEELKARLALLELHGETILVDVSVADSGSPPEGPTSHITEGDLDTGGWADASSVVPRLRRDDQL